MAQVAAKEAEEEALLRERQAVEKEKRLLMAKERKRREFIEARKREMSVLYERERVFFELRFEAKTRIEMERQDYRSLQMMIYEADCKAALESHENASRKRIEIAVFRKEEAKKRIEEKFARERGTLSSTGLVCLPALQLYIVTS